MGIGGVLVACLLLPMPQALPAGLFVGGLVYVATGFLRLPNDDRLARAELPEALEFLSVCLESGATSMAAVETVASISPPTTQQVLQQVASHLAVGRTPEDAWAALGDHPVWGEASRELARSARSGTALAEVLVAHAEDARQERRDAELRRARSVGVKSVLPLMACFLPAFILVGVIPIIGALIQQFIR